MRRSARKRCTPARAPAVRVRKCCVVVTCTPRAHASSPKARLTRGRAPAHLTLQVRLQQQIGALQKRLLRTQIDELQSKVVIGGRPIEAGDAASTPSTSGSGATTPLGSTPGSGTAADAREEDLSMLSPSSLSVSLAAERRRADKLESRVRR
jgi:hypothetical protein